MIKLAFLSFFHGLIRQLSKSFHIYFRAVVIVVILFWVMSNFAVAFTCAGTGGESSCPILLD